MAIRGILFDKDGTIIDYCAHVGADQPRGGAAMPPRATRNWPRELLRRDGHDPDTDAVTAGSLLAAGSIAEIAEAFAAHLGVAHAGRPDGRHRAHLLEGGRQALPC